MDNKYGLGSARVAHAHQDAKLKGSAIQGVCGYCGSQGLVLCPTMNDHFCRDCGRYQEDMPAGYATGRSADY